MKNRVFGKLGFEGSTFGIGCMRLPEIKMENGKNYIDEAAAIEMIRYGIDHGVTYIDTAYPYHGGKSEALVAKALKDGYREKVKLATKLPTWLTHTYEDFDKFLDLQLKTLEVETIDFYLLHAIDGKRFDQLVQNNVFEFLNKAVAAGKIKYPSFSFHGELKDFKRIIDAYDWSMCQIQLNILDEDYQAGLEGLKYAGAHNVPVVIMEPLKGGKLAQSTTDELQGIWDQNDTKRTPVEWAFRWLYNFPEVATILSGVSNMAQLQDNLRIFDEADANSMTEKELGIVQEAKNYYKRKILVGCTGCEYCLPCPAGVAIPQIFSLYNDASLYNAIEKYTLEYEKLIAVGKDASACVRCGQCEGVCPQNLHIMDQLQEAHVYLGGK